MPRLPTMSVVLAMMMACAVGCGSESSPRFDDDNEEKDAGDGKVYPPPNGQHIGENEACEALLAGQESMVKTLMCSITTRTCPALLRVAFVTQCMEYDEGSVKGCVAHYQAQKDCVGLGDAIANCVVTPYPGTEPAGCPMPAP